jgi:predicted nucleic acid-binding protein
LVVFDSWALLAYLGGEPTAGRIESAWLEEGARSPRSTSARSSSSVSARREKSRPPPSSRDLLEVIEPDWPLVSTAASIKAGGGLSYADCFCIATALRMKAPLWTGDPEIIGRAAEDSCEVVDLRA